MTSSPAPIDPSLSLFQTTLQQAASLREIVDLSLEQTSSWRADQKMQQIWKARLRDIDDFFDLVSDRFPLDCNTLSPEEEEALSLSTQYLLIQQNELRRRLCCPFPIAPLLGILSTVACCLLGVKK